MWLRKYECQNCRFFCCISVIDCTGGLTFGHLDPNKLYFYIDDYCFSNAGSSLVFDDNDYQVMLTECEEAVNGKATSLF